MTVTNRVTLKYLGADMYQVNLNGKGMYFPAKHELALEQMKSVKVTARRMTKRGERY